MQYKRLYISGLIACLSWLTACTGLFLETQPYTYVPPKTKAEQKCAAECPKQETQCKRACEAQKNNCLQNARIAGARSYLQYVNERMAQDLLVDKTEKDFYTQAANCPELKYCNERCEVSHRYCHTHCGGKVVKSGNCIANCDPAAEEQSLYDILFPE